MKATDKRVLDLLNEVLTAELTAINQYFVHAEMSDNWGYEHRYEKVRSEAMAEMKHAEKLIERILFLEGIPNVQRLGKIVIGETVHEHYLLTARHELAAYDRAVTDWELARYFERI